jgi:hypothetical protein
MIKKLKSHSTVCGQAWEENVQSELERRKVIFKTWKKTIPPYIYKEFCKCEIYHCHYVITGYHSNKLSSVNMLLEHKFCFYFLHPVVL